MATVTTKPPRVRGIVVRRGVDRVVVVLGVGRIDGDEGQIAPILAALRAGGLRRFGLRQDVAGKDVAGCHERGSR